VKGAAVPLSEHEQRLLEQMEKALYAEDPKFATSLRSANSRTSRGRAALGVLGVLVGMGMVLAGVATMMIALGIIGFALMLVSAFIAYSAFKAPATVSIETDTPVAPRKAKSSNGFMDRMEDRWRNRGDGTPGQ